VDHIKRVTDEFGRQAQTFDLWAEKTDDQVADRFRTALAKAGQGNVLDVACGPGVVTAAIAPGATSVMAFDATEQMLEKTRARCAKAGLRNVQFRRGDAEILPFDEAQFDGRAAGGQDPARRILAAHAQQSAQVIGFPDQSAAK
jgi:ubiquinone/menaquinone biosynthesis C-methylase UbiE